MTLTNVYSCTTLSGQIINNQPRDQEKKKYYGGKIFLVWLNANRRGPKKINMKQVWSR